MSKNLGFLESSSSGNVATAEKTTKQHVKWLAQRSAEWRCLQPLQPSAFDKAAFKFIRLAVKKGSADVISSILDEVVAELQRENAQTRLAAFRLIDYFFVRSHLWRTSVVDRQLQNVMLFALETDAVRYPLPQPADFAVQLRSEAPKALTSWCEKYAKLFTKLQACQNYLRNCVQTSREVATVEREIRANQQHEQSEVNRRARLHQRALEIIRGNVEECCTDCRKCLTELNSAIELLIPTWGVDFADVETTTAVAPKQTSSHIPESTVSIVLPAKQSVKVNVDSNMAPVAGALHDSAKSLKTTHLRGLKSCVSKLGKLGDDQSAREMLKQCLALKCEVESALSKVGDMDFMHQLLADDSDVQRHDAASSDDEFEHVVEKLAPSDRQELERHHEGISVSNPSLSNSVKVLVNEDQPCSSTAQTTSNMPDNSMSSEQSSRRIPTLSYDLDLEYWEKQELPKVPIVTNEGGCDNIWWRKDDTDEAVRPSTSKDEYYRMRLIEFSGSAETSSIPECGQPLSDGRKCPRRDAGKCPIHSKATASAADETPAAAAPWLDGESMREIEAATGAKLDFGVRQQQQRRKRAKTNGKDKVLSKDAHKPKSRIVRERLSKRLFNKASLKRVGEVLDAAQAVRNERLFGQHFQYHR